MKNGLLWLLLSVIVWVSAGMFSRLPAPAAESGLDGLTVAPDFIEAEEAVDEEASFPAPQGENETTPMTGF